MRRGRWALEFCFLTDQGLSCDDMSEPELPSEEAALEAQQELLESSLPLVFEAFDAATKTGISLPIVFLIDCEDEIGSQIVQEWVGAETVEDAVEHRHLMESESQTTVFAHAFPWKDCCKEVPEVFPYLAPVFEGDYPKDGFLAIAVTRGGASVFTVPFAARES
jgi:hypothetical protein